MDSMDGMDSMDHGRHGLGALRALAVLMALSTWPMPALAQVAADGDAAEPDPIFFEALDVQVVNVEVFVTDRQGHPVTGLEIGDFELREDGRPVEITNFYAVEGGRARAGLAEPAPPASVDEPATGRPPAGPAPVPEDQRLHLILYFDNLHLRPFNRNRVIREAHRFLATHVGPEDRVMVVTFERNLHVRQPFTADRNEVRDALDGLETLTAYAVQTAEERHRVIQNIERSQTFDQAEPHVDFYARERHLDLERSIDALRELIATLAGLPGRKALLYVSDGVPMVAGADLFHLLDLRFGEGATGSLRAQRFSARSSFRELTAAANANRVTLYTLEAAGLRSHASLSAESRASATGGSMIEIDLTYQLNRQEPLEMMALDTGGLSAFNTNNIGGALERMGADFDSYYSLGYVPARAGDGRIHTLDVEVKQGGLKVRHRRSYRDKTPETRLTEGVLAALHHGGEVNPLGVRLDVASGRRRSDGGNFLVPFTVSVPFRRVTLVPRSDFHRGLLRLVVAVIDEDGDTSTPESTTLPLEIPAAAVEEVMEQDVVYTAELLMRRGLHHVAVALYDEMSGETAIVRRAVRVGR